MHIPILLQKRFEAAIADLTPNASRFAQMIRATANPVHGDYQANCAMPLSKQLGVKDAGEVAAQIVDRLQVDDICKPPQTVKGFINLTLHDAFILQSMVNMLNDPRCLVGQQESPSTIVLDYSSPNVAKPMHVGHIRSTVIGDALARILEFLGFHTVTDNHLGDWGTQFGIIIYGYKHFGDPDIVRADPVPELTKLYRLVNQLVEYRKAVASLPALEQNVVQAQASLQQATADAETADPKEAKKKKKAVAAAERKLVGHRAQIESAKSKIAVVESDPDLSAKAAAHPDIDAQVLVETAKLHDGDQENLALWHQFMPHCQDEIDRIYRRLDVEFDHTLGESFYHSMLADVVSELEHQGLASESEGAICVFLKGFDAPMIVRKRDGAYLYATTDLATLKYRLKEFDPAEILYVVDTRQGEHFEKLFAVAKKFGMEHIKLVHVNFGTVLDKDGRPIKTRSGTLIGLEGLLNDAVDRARQVVCDPGRLVSFEPPMDEAEREQIAEVVGIGAIKFADLSHHRTSDYRFNLEKMVALDGNTSAYVQYSYTRTQAILLKAGVSEADVIAAARQTPLQLTHSAERSLALMLMRFEEALQAVHQDYAPNQLVDYLLDTAKAYSIFNEKCHVIRAESEAIKTTRLVLVTLCGRVIRQGLALLGIGVVPRM
ncbi:MAG: arginine--tRNA ligase [Pirellulales bacterium]|nr:arginine--tRNA ligase [Pirellulales bacterium]